jgi:hypothetical protein
MQVPARTPREATGRVWHCAICKYAAFPSMTANDVTALNDLRFASGRPGRQVGRVKQPEGLSHEAPMVLSGITIRAGAAYK